MNINYLYEFKYNNSLIPCITNIIAITPSFNEYLARRCVEGE